MSSQDLTEYRYNPLFENEDTSINSILKGLVELGLTQNEAKVYMYLAKSGAKKAIEVSKALNMPRTETYHLLSKLQSKGLVLITIQHPIKYMAKPFEETIETLIEIVENKIKNLEKKRDYLLSQWRSLPEFVYNNEERDKLQILEGKASVYGKARELCKSASSKLIIVVKEKELLSLYNYNILDGIEAEVSIDNELDAPSFIIKDYKEMLLFLENEGKDVIALWTDCKTLIQSMELLFKKLLH